MTPNLPEETCNHPKVIQLLGLETLDSWIDLNFCSNVQCLKSQTFSNSYAKNCLDLLTKVEGESDGTKCGEVC